MAVDLLLYPPTRSVAVVTRRRSQTSISGLRSSMSHQSFLFLGADALRSLSLPISVSLPPPPHPQAFFPIFICMKAISAHTAYFLKNIWSIKCQQKVPRGLDDLKCFDLSRNQSTKKKPQKTTYSHLRTYNLLLKMSA